jgi:hypothetical protein
VPFTTILSIVSTLAIVSGGIFAAIQLRQLKRQRSRESAIQLLQTARTREFLEAINIVFELPEGLSKKEIEDRLGEKMTYVLVMFGTFESLGILVFRREIDIELVEDFFRGVILFTGRKFKNYLREVRETSNRQTYYEWVTWLYEQMEKRESKAPRIPAFEAYREWES